LAYVFRLLKAAKWNSRKLNKQLRKAINEKNWLVIELKSYNDLFAKIQGSIHEMLTNRLSILKDIENTIKIGHHEDLLARIDNLGEVKKHLPKLQETIKIATAQSPPFLQGFMPTMEMISIFIGCFCLCRWTLKIMLGFEMQLNPWQQRLHKNMD
jgi:sugar-specific transcriptional regulator TrmB